MKTICKIFFSAVIIIVLIAPLNAQEPGKSGNLSGIQSPDSAVDVSKSAVNVTDLNATNSSQLSEDHTYPDGYSSKINITPSQRLPDTPVFRLISPKIRYSISSSENPGSLETTIRLPIPVDKKTGLIDKHTLTVNQKKLTTSLLLTSDPTNLTAFKNMNEVQLSLITKTAPQDDTMQALTSQITNNLSGELVNVYIHILPGNSTHCIDSYVSEVADRDEENNLIVAWVDRYRLDAVASAECVRSMEEVIPPVVNIGTALTQGDTIHKTADVRSLDGFTGTGMKIGVISDGVFHLADSVNSGDLPDNVNVLSIGSGDEGTAMLEIIHDMVPNATLYFHDAGMNTLEFNNAIDTLQANGCTVIVDDISWVDEPFFEDGVIATHVSTLVNDPGNPLIYVSSAGNAAQRHFQGDFFPDGTTNFTDFSRGSGSKSLYVNLPGQSTVWIVLEWNDQFGHSANDYDLFLSESKIGDLAQSIGSQTGTQDPVEFIAYTNLGMSTITGKIDVSRYNGDAKTLELYIYPFGGATVYSDNIVAADSIFGHPAVPGVISTAAVYQGSPTVIEPFSSQGPVTIAYPSPMVRQKPDISGVDGVSIFGAGGFPNPFFGTSAAAPHIAAVAAQIWGGHPSFSSQNIRNALYNSAVDLGPAGRDTIFGYGKADALEMATSLNITNPVSAPVANFNATPTTGAAPLTVRFMDLSTNVPYAWNWSFGDGSIVNATLQNPVHTYLTSGNYTVSLNASNGGGSNTITRAGYINVTNVIASTIGVFRPSTHLYYRDFNGNGVWDGAAVDRVSTFGITGDLPVSGKWA